MRYACNQRKYPESQWPPFWPCDVFDSNSQLIEGSIEHFDTETGEVICVVLKEDGQPDVVDDEFLLCITIHPAPLTIAPKDFGVRPIIVEATK